MKSAVRRSKSAKARQGPSPNHLDEFERIRALMQAAVDRAIAANPYDLDCDWDKGETD